MWDAAALAGGLSFFALCAAMLVPLEKLKRSERN